MFLPSGEVLTNLPTFQGEAAVVLGYSLQAAPSVVGGNPAIELQQAKGPVVVWCSILGEVRLEGGLQKGPPAGLATRRHPASPRRSPH